jgi:hypothetical protein
VAVGSRCVPEFCALQAMLSDIDYTGGSRDVRPVEARIHPWRDRCQGRHNAPAICVRSAAARVIRRARQVAPAMPRADGIARLQAVAEMLAICARCGPFSACSFENKKRAFVAGASTFFGSARLYACQPKPPLWRLQLPIW